MFFCEGLAAVKLNGKWGYIDEMGTEVIPFIYDMAYSFEGEFAEVVLNGTFRYIDITGEIFEEIE